MELKRAEGIDWTPAGDEHFTGNVWFGPLSHAHPEALNALAVQFEPGARTDWHTHAEGQVLYCVSGAGRVQTDAGETVEFGPGDVIYAPPGERHWHGAAPASPMVHLSLTTGPPTEWFPDKVDDTDYGRTPGG
jgi:quercetin dioxygenase-like cupin family protein